MRNLYQCCLCLMGCLLFRPDAGAQETAAWVDTCNERAYSFYYQYPDSVIFYGQLALGGSEKIHYDSGRVRALVRLTRGYTDKGAYEQAQVYGRQAMQAARDNREPRYEADANLQLAIIKLRQTRYPEALEHALIALALFERAGDRTGAVMAYTRIGQVYSQTKRFDQAIQTFRKGLETAEQIGDQKTAAFLNGELGAACKNQVMDEGRGSFKPAIQYYNRAIALLTAQGVNEVWITYLGLSNLYAEGLHDSGKALQYAKKALEIVEQSGDQYGHCQVLTAFAKRLNEAGRAADANRTLRQAQVLAEQEQFADLLPLIYFERGTAFSALSVPDSMQYFLRAYGFALEKRLSQTYDHKLAELETKYETAEKEKQLVLLQNEKNSQDLRLQRQETELLRQHLLSAEQMAAITSLTQEKRIRELELARQAGATREAQLLAGRQTAELQTQRERTLAWRNGWFALAVAALAFVVGIWQYLRFRRIRQEQRIKLEFARQMAELETRTLRAQMNPHFIFNALSSIKKFVLTNDTDSAEIYLSKFARLIRLILENSRETTATLRNEIDLLDNYIQLERLRSGGRFDYTMDCEGELIPEDIEIPSLVLQPFVENAIVHGLNNRTEPGGRLTLRFYRVSDSLHVLILDNGVGRERAQAQKSADQRVHHRSFGLDITRQRLDAFAERFGRAPVVTIADLKNENGQGCGTRVELEIPVGED